jgi:hypothetical protein
MPWYYDSTDPDTNVGINYGGETEAEAQARATQMATDKPTWTIGDPYEQDASWYDAQPRPKMTVTRKDGSEYYIMTDGSIQEIA